MSKSPSSYTEQDSGYERLERQIDWYDEKSGDAQSYYKRIKFFEFALGAAVPIMAAARVDGLFVASIGAISLVLAGLQQMNQWQHNWITYRSTCEFLRHEKFCFLGKAGAYEGQEPEAARRLLVERVEGLVSTEHSKWLSLQETKIARNARKQDSK